MTIRNIVERWDKLNTLTEFHESAMDELEEYSMKSVRILNGNSYIINSDGQPCTITTVKDITMLVRSLLHGVHECEDTITDNKFNSSLRTTGIQPSVLLEFDVKFI